MTTPEQRSEWARLAEQSVLPPQKTSRLPDGRVWCINGCDRHFRGTQGQGCSVCTVDCGRGGCPPDCRLCGGDPEYSTLATAVPALLKDVEELERKLEELAREVERLGRLMTGWRGCLDNLVAEYGSGSIVSAQIHLGDIQPTDAIGAIIHRTTQERDAYRKALEESDHSATCDKWQFDTEGNLYVADQISCNCHKSVLTKETTDDGKP